MLVGRNAGELRAHEWSVRPGLLMISLVLQIAGLLGGVYVWRMLLNRMGFGVRYEELARIWFVSGLGRYIPGKVWHFVGAAHLGGTAGLPATVTVTSLAVHTGIFTVAAGMTGVYLLPQDVGMEGASTMIASARWLAPLAILLLHPAIIQLGISTIRRLTGREFVDWNGRWRDGILLLFLAVIIWILIGFAFSLFLRSLTPLPAGSTISVVGIHALAFVAGYLAFFVPAGLGAKEGALAGLLTLYVSAPVAAMLAIAARLWTVAGETVPAILLLVRRTPANDSVTRAQPSSSAEA